MCPTGWRSFASSPWRGFADPTTWRCASSRPLLFPQDSLDAFCVELLQAFDHGPAARQLAPIDLAHWYDAGEGPGDERLVGPVYVGEGEILLDRRNARFPRDLQHQSASDPAQA